MAQHPLIFFKSFLQVLSRQDVAYFRGLMSEVERTELVTDELYTLDVQFITDDDKYFPFEVGYFVLDRDTAVLIPRVVPGRFKHTHIHRMLYK